MDVQKSWSRLTNAYRSTLIAGTLAAVVAVSGGFAGHLLGIRAFATVFTLVFFTVSYTVFAEYLNNPRDGAARAERRRKLFADGIMLLAMGGGALALLYAPNVTRIAPDITSPTTVLVFGAPTFSTGLFAILAALAVRD